MTPRDLPFEALFRHLPDAIAVCDASGRILLLNAEAERLFNCQCDELLGESISMLLPGLLPGRERWWLDPEGVELRPLDSVARRGGGDEFAATVRLRAIDELDDGDPAHVVVVVRPVTAPVSPPTEQRPPADALLKAIAPSGIIFATVDRDLRYTWIFNPHPDFSPAEAVGRRDDELADTEGSRQLMQLKREALERELGGRREIRFELSNSVHTYDVTAVPLHDDETGKVVGVATAAVDVTNLRALMHHQEELFAMVVHDLRNPVAAIHGHAHRLRVHSPDAQEILRHTSRLERMVGDLFSSAMVGAGRFELRRERVELGALVRAVAEHVSLNGRHHIQVQVPEALIVGFWDPHYLERVVENLLTNAMRYSPPDASITLVVSDLGLEARVLVRDEGMGIAPAEVPVLFDAFFRSEKTRGARLPGAGLGLYIAKGVVEAHGGRIWVESAGEGAGSTFSFTLPYRPEDAALPAAPEHA